MFSVLIRLREAALLRYAPSHRTLQGPCKGGCALAMRPLLKLLWTIVNTLTLTFNVLTTN